MAGRIKERLAANLANKVSGAKRLLKPFTPSGIKEELEIDRAFRKSRNLQQAAEKAKMRSRIDAFLKNDGRVDASEAGQLVAILKRGGASDAQIGALKEALSRNPLTKTGRANLNSDSFEPAARKAIETELDAETVAALKAALAPLTAPMSKVSVGLSNMAKAIHDILSVPAKSPGQR